MIGSPLKAIKELRVASYKTSTLKSRPSISQLQDQVDVRGYSLV